jgi:hypothetical protein
VSLTFLSIIGFANIWVLVALVRRRRKLLAKGSAFDDSAKLKRSSENLQADPVIEIASDNAQLTSAADAGNDGDALTPSELLIKPSAATDDVNDNDKSGAVMAYGCFTRCCPALLRVSAPPCRACVRIVTRVSCASLLIDPIRCTG